MKSRAPLAVSLGDPAGVGPELIAEAWLRRDTDKLPAFFVVGGGEVLCAAAKARGHQLTIARVRDPHEANAAFAIGLPVLGSFDCQYLPGNPEREGAKLALASLALAARHTVSGEARALVTAPIAKAQLAEVGFAHPGQTEFVAQACGMASEDAVMMLAGPNLRTVPITVHLALADVPRSLSRDLIVRRAVIVARALQRDFGIARPRLAVCGLNPHAGEDGLFGLEEREIIAPAIAALRAEGLEASGPHPADALFSERLRATYDVAIAMYHDQALIPLKTLDFDNGVNVTLGLPIVRTSPDHGTAFAIAGKNQADPGALIAALRMADDCARRRARQ